MKTLTRKDGLYPEAVNRLHKDLLWAKSDPDRLNGISGRGLIADFEELFLKTAGGRYAVALCNCTSALLTALLSCEAGAGDEVILPVLTWPQTLGCVLAIGATPVFLDCGERSLNAEPKAIVDLITDRTKAVILTHHYGIPCARPEFKKHHKRIPVIYDAAQSFTAAYKDSRIGDNGDYVAFSLGHSKALSIGEGGMLICNSRPSYEKAVGASQHPFRQHLQINNAKTRRNIDGVNLNFRMHPLIASLGTGQLQGFRKEYPYFLRRYKKSMKKIIEAGLGEFIPSIPDDAIPCGNQIPLITPREKKDWILKTLRQLNMRHFEQRLTALYKTKAIKRIRIMKKKYPITKAIEAQTIIVVFID